MPITPFNQLRNPQSVGRTFLKSDGSTVTTGTGYAVIVRLNTVMYRRWEPCLPLTNPITFNCGTPPIQINEFNVDASTPGLVDLGGSGIDASDWDDCCSQTGQPTHASYTAFISFDDWANSDLSQIATNPATWQKDEKLIYKFESKDPTWEPQANGAVRATAIFSFSIIEVVDETMYNAGAGIPVDNTISNQYATYGDIPVGTIMATPGDPNCNGCTDLYENLGIKIRQGEIINQNPGYFLESKGPQQISGSGAGAEITSTGMHPYDTSFSWPYLMYDQLIPIVDLAPSDILLLSNGFTSGWYFGKLWNFESIALQGTCESCRDPLALNYDKSTSPVFGGISSNNPVDPNNVFYTSKLVLTGNTNFQRDCEGAVFQFDNINDPINSSGVPGPLGNTDCCLYSTELFPPSGSGSGTICPDNVNCGCLDTNAANFCTTCTEDCNNITGGSDTSCCEYYHLWEICGAHGAFTVGYNNLAGTIGGYPNYYNLAGDSSNSWNVSLPNNPDTNEEFMTYLEGFQGAPSPFQVGDRIQLRSMGNPGNWWCLEYHGPKPNNAVYYDNLAGGNATSAHWISNGWWNTPPATDGLGNLIMDESCANCADPTLGNESYSTYEVCDGIHAGRTINIINSWATDPVDHLQNVQPNNPNYWSFENEIGLVKPNMSCSSCQNGVGWLLVGDTLNVRWNEIEYCLVYTGSSSSPQGTDTGGWVEGIGPGTDDFIRIDPQDPYQLNDIFDNCADCNTVVIDPCTPICTDKNSPNYHPAPWPINACDCNGDQIGTYAMGWNSCCDEDPCDGKCKDPQANNYDPNATGCCGSGAGIGTPTSKNIAGVCDDADFIITQPLSTAGFHQYISTQANSLTATVVNTIQYENMDSVWFGQPTPPGACVGPNGGYMASFAFGSGYMPHSSIAADVNPGAPGTIYQTWDSLITQCLAVSIPGVTTQTTFDELNILLTAWNPNGAGIPVEITPPTNVFCQCEYATYGPNTDCCTYNWECSKEVPAFALSWPTQDSNSIQSNVKTQYNKKFGLVSSDVNPRPESTFNHINDSGYVFPGLAYLNTSLTLSTFRNLGLHFNTNDGSQGWKGGKQPKISYVEKYPQEWAYAYSFMQAITDGTITNGDTLDLTKAYYKVKTNMISLEGNFVNKKAKLITTPIAGGTADSGLYYHIIPAGAITIPQQFESVFPTVAGKQFNTWKSFKDELLNYNLPASATTWETVSKWVIEQVQKAPGLMDVAWQAAPEFVEQTTQWMVKATSGCLCFENPDGPYETQEDCQKSILDPVSGNDNCCACVYGCTDPLATNYDPLATCDDGSCEGCDPFIIRFCSDVDAGIEIYHRAYLGNNGDPQTCANSQALIQAWGLQNYWDVVGVNYMDNGVSYTYCVQWVDPNSSDYQTWLANNPPSPTAQFFPTIATTANNFTYTPNDPTLNPDTQCQFCYGVGGCTDPLALNYNKNCAGTTVVPTFDDGCCQYCVYGCTNNTTVANAFPDINGYDNTAVYDCSVSTTVPTSGSLCPYPCTAGYEVSNYNPCATCDDGSCEKPRYHKWSACSGSPAGEFAIVSPGSTWNDIFAQDWFYHHVGAPNIGETINTASGADHTCYEYKGEDSLSPASSLTPLPQLSAWYFDEVWNTDCTSCQCIYGCTDATACNYDAAASCDDGSCCNETGCLDPQAFNYCPTCCCEGPCEPVKEGCMDPTANNYDPTANTPCADCCDYTIYGCTDINAINFDPTATVNQTSATDPTDPCKYLDQCKRAPREFGSDPTKKLNVECEFASDVYKEYRKQRYGLSNYCGSDLPDHLHAKQICDWEDSKRPAYLSSKIEVLATYEYPIVDGEPNWMDPLRPAWTENNCGLTSDVDIDIYFMYDCTSMGQAAVAQQRTAADEWIDGLEVPFKGNVYHVLVTGERWVDWATTIFTGEFNNAGTCGGIYSCCTEAPTCASPDFGTVCVTGAWVDAEPTQNQSATNKFWASVAWGNANNKPWYASAPSSLSLGSLTQLGYPPALTKREVLGVFFADEAASGSTPQPYHVSGPTLNGSIVTWPQATDGTGTAVDGSDSVITPCFIADYDKYIEKYKEHLAKGPLHKATMVIYPAKPLTSPNADQRAFPLHALAAVDSGNNTPKDGRYATGTAPTNSLVDLVRIETGNPYWDTPNPNQPSSHTYGYGGLDNYGWNANVASGTFNVDVFKADLESYWDPNKLKCDGSECIVVNVVNQNNVAVPDYDIYVDGGFVGKTDEFGRLKFQIENAAVKTNHIINLCLCIETKGNCRQQQVKITVNEECAPECCVDPSGVSCETYKAPTQVFEGCTDPNASNYNPMATADDGSCLYCDPGVSITETHANASSAGVNDGSITAVASNGTIPYTYSWTGPSGYTANTAAITGLAGGVYTLIVTDANNCTNTIVVNLDQPPLIYGCMDSTTGLWPNINGLNQSGAVCTYPCTSDGTLTGTPEGYKYFCYNPDATNSDTCCEAGCTDPNAVTGPQGYCASCTHDCNMEPIGTNNPGWDSCCQLCNEGCMDPIAGNYDPLATCDDGSCIYYWECDEAGYGLNEITLYNYQLSSYNSNGIYIDTTCAAGYCDYDQFYTALADHYSSSGNESLIPGLEVTAIGDGTSASYMNWGVSPCPLSVLDSYFPNASVMPLLTINGFTTENPFGATASNSCYAQLQIAQFGAGYVFNTWQAYVDWHNGAGGPNQTCSGSQIPVLLSGQDYSHAVNAHYIVNTGTQFQPDPEDNWVYYNTVEPQCSNYSDCECNQVLTANDNDGFPGTYPTQQECLDDVNTCCGEPEPVYGCIDDGDVMNNPLAQDYFAQAGLAGNSNQDWWDGQNQANISYSQHNNPMSVCENGIIHEELTSNGGNGIVGTGVSGTYPLGIPALNYNPLATHDDGSCCYCTGCTDPTDVNYESAACFDNPDLCGGQPDPENPGCMDPNAITYDPAYNLHVPSACTYAGCLDQTAINYGNFEANNQPSYTYQGTTYGLSDITAGCASCCNYPTNGWGCVSSNLQNPEFFDGTGATVIPSFANRIEATRIYQVTQNGTGCQTMFDAPSNYDDPQNVMYMWSHGAGTAVEHFNDWYYWRAQNSNFGSCIMSQAQMTSLYTTTGWESPAGVNSFTIGSQSPFDNNLFSHCRAKTVCRVYLERAGLLIHEVVWTDSDTSWVTFRDTLINNHGFDGSGSEPDITGLDFDQVVQAIAPTSYQLIPEMCSCNNATSNEKMCLQIPSGTNPSCDDCVNSENCGTC